MSTIFGYLQKDIVIVSLLVWITGWPKKWIVLGIDNQGWYPDILQDGPATTLIPIVLSVFEAMDGRRIAVIKVFKIFYSIIAPIIDLIGEQDHFLLDLLM